MPITGEVTVGANKFKYGEVSYGTRRAIKISTARNVIEYQFQPDVHDNPKYNKSGGQEKFYKSAAEKIGALYNSGAKFPDAGASINVLEMDHTLTIR